MPSAARWLLMLALPMVLPVPAPGISVLFGVPLMILSAQLMLGLSASMDSGNTRAAIGRADRLRGNG